METKTFSELYYETKKQPTPTQLFIEEIAKLTKCKTETVRSWAIKKVNPGKYIQIIISAHFGVPASKLFPPKK